MTRYEEIPRELKRDRFWGAWVSLCVRDPKSLETIYKLPDAKYKTLEAIYKIPETIYNFHKVLQPLAAFGADDRWFQ